MFKVRCLKCHAVHSAAEEHECGGAVPEPVEAVDADPPPKSSQWRHRDPEAYRAYMRDYMRRRRGDGG